MKIGALLALGLLLFSFAVLAQRSTQDAKGSETETDVLEFKGLRIGSSPDELKAKYPELRCTEPKVAAVVERSPFKEHWERQKIYADLQCNTVSDPRLPLTALSNIVGHRARSFNFNFMNGKLERAYATISAAAFDALISGLISRYGPPSSRKYTAVQNRMGAQFQNEKLTWKEGNASIEVEKYYTDIETSIYELSSDTYWPEVERRRTERDGPREKTL